MLEKDKTYIWNYGKNKRKGIKKKHFTYPIQKKMAQIDNGFITKCLALILLKKNKIW